MLEFPNQLTIIHALFGGILIGLSASILLLFMGRIAGVCGIAFSILDIRKPTFSLANNNWRWLFLIGLILGTYLSALFIEFPIPSAPTSNIALLIIGGLLTGYGTKLANGCTSGHGVCGISRLSNRSILATITFIGFGIITVSVLRHIVGVL